MSDSNRVCQVAEGVYARSANKMDQEDALFTTLSFTLPRLEASRELLLPCLGVRSRRVLIAGVLLSPVVLEHI